MISPLATRSDNHNYLAQSEIGSSGQPEDDGGVVLEEMEAQPIRLTTRYDWQLR